MSNHEPHIRPAAPADAARMAEIEVFNYRLYFYPIFRSDAYYFDEMQVVKRQQLYQDLAPLCHVYDDGAVKGFICAENGHIRKLFVEPVLQDRGIGHRLLQYAIDYLDARSLWVLEKNPRARQFYERHGFRLTGENQLEDGTQEYLLRMERA